MRAGGAALAAATLAAGATAVAGETRCWIDKGALVAPAAFGGIAGDFLIDLSSPASVIGATEAATHGADAPRMSGDLALAGQRLPGLTLSTADLDARTRGFDTVINGVIGADVLGRYQVDLRFSPCRLTLSRRAGPRLAGATRLPVWMAGGRPAVVARVTDGMRVRDGRFAIDTAHWASQVPGRLSRWPSTDPAAPRSVRLRAVEVGGRLFEQVPASVAPAPGDGARGAIGLAVWSRWRVRLEMRAGWLDLAPPPK